MSYKPIKRLFRDITITSSGLEIGDILNASANVNTSGFVQQIVFEQTSGSATTLSSIQIRYETGSSAATNLVYSATSSALTDDVFSDSYIAAPFSLGNPEPADSIILFAQSDATGVFDIRVDLEISVV